MQPYPPPLTSNPANQPAIKPTTIQESIPILNSISLYDGHAIVRCLRMFSKQTSRQIFQAFAAIT
jgi:hypothetical protein